MGAKGRNVVLERQHNTPLITNDGVTIAKAIELDDPFENMGAQLVKEVATKTNDIAGDGTTTATVLTQALIKEGLKNITSGANPMIVRAGIQKAVDVCVDAIKNNSVKVNGKTDIARVATVSAANEYVGSLIADIIDEVGENGVITVEESKTSRTEKEIVKGMQFERGFLSPYMITDSEKNEAVLDNPYILITDKKISNIQDILPLLEQIVQSGEKLLIIADDIEGEALTALVVNKLRGTFTCVGVKAPAFGDRRKAILQDIAILTGGTVISSDVGIELKNATIDMLGRAHQTIIGKENTIIVDGCGDAQNISNRINQIKAEYDNTDVNFDKDKLKERLAKLSGGVAVIKVGASTEVEMQEMKLRIEDALNATRAAIEEGIVPGGGTAYINIIDNVLTLIETLDGDEKTGAKIVLKALEEPVKQICKNAGVEGAVVVEKIKSSDKGIGYNAFTDKYVNMIEDGIVDPAKVTRSALQNSASVASMVLTTESLVAEKTTE